MLQTGLADRVIECLRKLENNKHLEYIEFSTKVSAFSSVKIDLQMCSEDTFSINWVQILKICSTF